MPAPRSSASSAVSGGSVATAAADRRVASTQAVADVIAPHTSAASGPRNFTMRAAGAPTTSPTMPETSDRRELARTNFGVVVDDGRHERGLRDAVRLAENEDEERQREQEQVVDMAHHEDAHERAEAGGEHDHETATAADPVDRRTDEWRHDGEGRHRQHEVEGDLVARRTGRDRKEQGPREGDGHQGVGRDRERMHPSQAGERRDREGIGGPGRRPGQRTP